MESLLEKHSLQQIFTAMTNSLLQFIITGSILKVYFPRIEMVCKSRNSFPNVIEKLSRDIKYNLQIFN